LRKMLLECIFATNYKNTHARDFLFERSSMPHASIPARGARGSDGGAGVGGGLKKKTRITTKARCTHLWQHAAFRAALVGA
jgi:hypothetical protein